MKYPNINNHLDDLEEIFDEIKENVSNYTNLSKKNKLLFKICDHGACGSDNCTEALNNGYLEEIEKLKNQISTLESTIEILKLNENQSIKTDSKNFVTDEQTFKKENAMLNLDKDRLKRSLDEAKIKYNSIISEIETLKACLDSSNLEIIKYKDEIRKQKEIIGQYKENEKNMQLCLDKANEEKLVNRKTIKKMKNEIMNLKGHVRVYCRIRPSCKAKANMILNDSSIVIANESKSLEYQFDKIFDDKCSQTHIFDECFDIIESVFDGYKICLFAYGQTGSGKTYTMEGDLDNPGLLHQTIKYVFDNKERYKGKGWDVEIKCNYIEIYNDEIFDLLNADNFSHIGKGNVEALKSKFEEKISTIIGYKKSVADKIKIIHEEGNTILQNCEERTLYLLNDAFKLIDSSRKRRSVGRTLCNDRSSRSHSIFTLNISMKTEQETRTGSICLIDLAGSERLNVSQSEGLRLKETQHINKSLSCLGDVFKAILENKSHIPFRNSKLTYFLQGYLSGNSRVAMVLNISPEEIQLNETLCTLRFGYKVSECKLGAIKRQVCKKII